LRRLEALARPSSEIVEIRGASPSDAAAIRALTRAAYAKWVPLIGREPLPMLADYDRALIEHQIDLLFADAELSGLIETTVEKDHLFIVNVAVAPSRQGRGYGRRLLGHAEALAASLLLPEARLATNKQFAANIALYLRLGYSIDREEPFMGGVMTHMMKQLA
jgi:ribosomal protein S18 acetylase RimI-like enzyme